MNERMHRVLDGELARSALSEAEARELAEAEALISGVLRAVPVQPMPDLAPAIMAGIAQQTPATPATLPAAPHAWQQLTSWLLSPRAIVLQWRPVYAFAMLALLAAPLLITRSIGNAPMIAEAQQVMIQFRLDAPDAQQVALAGNFTNWQPSYQLTRTASGVWTVIVPLSEGVHKYAFIVDGETWRADPMAPSVSDGFGGQNSQIAVLSPDGSEQT